MATGWLRGTVKAVPSGDSLVIMGSAKSGPPPEKSITLSSLMAPKLARRGGRDEAFAWDSREYLRKKCIGKEVTFKVDYVVQSIGRDFGTVFLGDVNLALAVVTDGWAKVRPQFGQNTEVSPYLAELERLEEQAKQQGLGIWSKTSGAAEASIRDLPPSALGDPGSFDALGLLESSKGKPLPAIVEQVRDGSTVRVYLLPSYQYVQVFVAGIQAPSMGRRALVTEGQVSSSDSAPKPSVADDAEPSAVNGENNGSSGQLTSAQKLALSNTAAASAEVQPDPYGVQAKHFTEVRVLHRDVRIVLEGVDKFNNLIGSVHYPEGNVAVDLALELLKMGFAKVVEWSANMLEEEAKRKLKSTELQAKKEKLCLWKNYVPPASNSTAIHNDNFTGKVIEVVSGDCVVVADDAAPYGSPLAERRVNLSSIRAPRVGNPRKDEKPAPYAHEAKEYLRTILIGHQVNVTMEYSRKISAADGPAINMAPGGPDSRVMDFGSVFLISPPKGENLDVAQSLPVPGQPDGVNIAEVIVAKGLATVVRHRDFEERSNYYDALIAAESRAVKGRKGIHSNREPPVVHINDLSLPGKSQKARQFLPFLQRARRLSAVVDYVLSGHRFKLIVPRETCAIAFALAGARCPGRGEPYSEDAIAFMRRKILQRDVEIEVEAVDKTGTFLGTLWESKSNVSVSLIEAGLAKLHPMFSPERTTEGHLLVQAQTRAKQERRKVWESHIEGEDAAASADLDSNKTKQEALQVRVTEILGGGKFYVQLATDARVSTVQKQLINLQLKDKTQVNFFPKKGDIVSCQYVVDGSWNRGMVVNVPKESPTSPNAVYEVFYIDYGNQERIAFSSLRPLDASVSMGTPGLAMLCSLAYVRVPELEDDYGQEAAEFLSGNYGDKNMMAMVVERDTTGGKVKGQGTGPKLIVNLFEVGSTTSVSAALVEEGLARVEKKNRWDTKEKQEELEKLSELQDKAKQKRQNIWCYGDISSGEEDETPARRGRR